MVVRLTVFVRYALHGNDHKFVLLAFTAYACDDLYAPKVPPPFLLRTLPSVRPPNLSPHPPMTPNITRLELSPCNTQYHLMRMHS